MADVRDQIVGWATWSLQNRSRFFYTEGPLRMSAVHANPTTSSVIYCDCSAFVTYCYSWAGAPDPNGQSYDGQGYTGTLLANGTAIGLAEVIPGDVVVYGPGTGEHTALIVAGGSNPLTVSMGQQGDPSYVYVNQDGRQPQRYLRFSTVTTNPPTPAPPTPTPGNTCMIQLRVLSQGMNGGDVRSLQKMLSTVVPDGSFGPATATAVRSFQTKVKLAADGVVGPNTWTALIASGSGA